MNEVFPKNQATQPQPQLPTTPTMAEQNTFFGKAAEEEADDDDITFTQIILVPTLDNNNNNRKRSLYLTRNG